MSQDAAAQAQDPTPKPEEERSGLYVDHEQSKAPLVRQTARWVNRVGYPILVVIILWFTIPILYGVLHGVWIDKAWDPDSKRPLSVHAPGNDCARWGRELMVAKHSPADALQDWNARCASIEPEIARSLAPPAP